MARPPKLSKDEAKRKILYLLEDGTVELSFHCRHESMPKRRLTMLDVVQVLKTGEIRKEPEWDLEQANWKYRVEGTDTEGDELRVITVIIEWDATLFIVTVF